MRNLTRVFLMMIAMVLSSSVLFAQVSTFSYTTGFETGAFPAEVVASSGSGADVFVSSSNSYMGTYSAFMEGNTSLGWGATPTTQAEAYDPSKSSHFGYMDIEIHPDIGNPDILFIGFWMRQGYSFSQNYSWLQCLVNGVNVADVDGNFYYQPSSHGDPWVYRVFDLSPYQNDASITFTFNSSCKYYYNYYQEGDVAMIDNIRIWYSDGLNDPPIAMCQDVTVIADGNCEGLVTPEQVDDGSYDPDGDPITLSLDPTGPYQLGETTVTLIIEDEGGNTDYCTATVTVVDATPPVVITIISPIVMWPANHQFVSFNVTDFVLSVLDNCASLTINDVNIIKATSDELENATGGGDGNTVDDMVIADDCKSIQLRKERNATGNGRVYTVYLELNDGNANTSTATCQVQVPHNIGATAIDDSVQYVEYGLCGNESYTSIDEINTVITTITMPNPFISSTSIYYILDKPSTVNIIIFNPQGQLIERIELEQPKGEQRVEWNAEGLPAGVYYYKIQAGEKAGSGKMVKMK
jgi:hypothetical protein